VQPFWALAPEELTVLPSHAGNANLAAKLTCSFGANCKFERKGIHGRRHAQQQIRK
jgi:hypothetical protein